MPSIRNIPVYRLPCFCCLCRYQARNHPSARTKYCFPLPENKIRNNRVIRVDLTTLHQKTGGYCQTRGEKQEKQQIRLTDTAPGTGLAACSPFPEYRNPVQIIFRMMMTVLILPALLWQSRINTTETTMHSHHFFVYSV